MNQLQSDADLQHKIEKWMEQQDKREETSQENVVNEEPESSLADSKHNVHLAPNNAMKATVPIYCLANPQPRERLGKISGERRPF